MTGAILVICPRKPARLMLALSALAALRAYHKHYRIVGLATPQTQTIARALPTFDDVWIDPRASLWDVRNTLDLRAELRSTPFERIYDFEQSPISLLYFHLLFGWPVNDQQRQTISWSGHVRGVGLFHAHAQSTSAHVMDRWKDQLKSAGVLECLPPDVSWAARQVRDFSAPFKMDQPFAMVCLDAESEDSWPADRFAALAEWLTTRKLTPLLVGFDEHAALAERIGHRCPDAIDITGKAPIIDTVFLSWAAAAAVGANSAFMHLAAIANCRSVVLCGTGVDPAVEGARGSRVKILKRGRLAEITTPEILTLLGDLGA
jgi:ADP-heptose:LPS heptosyltransferase